MAILFNSSPGDINGDLLRRTSGLINNNGACTISFWYKHAADNNRINILYFITNGTGSEYLGIGGDGVTLVFTSLINPSSGYTVSGPALTPGTWYYLTVVRPNSTAAPLIYVNGVHSFSGVIQNVGTRAAANKWDIGCGNPDGGSPAGGTFAFLRAWQSALSSVQINVEKNAQTAVLVANLHGDWPLIGGSGQFQSDVSGQGRTWTVRGTIGTNQEGPALPQTITLPQLSVPPTLFTHSLIKFGAEVITLPLISVTPTVHAPDLIRRPVKIDLGVDAKSSVYEYRGLRATEIELTYYPKQNYSGLLWETKSEDPSTVKAEDTREIFVSPETAEGFRITPFTVHRYGSGGSTFTALDDSLVNRASDVAASITQEGQRLRLFWDNPVDEDLTITAEIYGTGYYAKDKQTLLVVDEDLLLQNNGRHTVLRVDLKLVADESEAQALAQHFLDLLRNQVDGVFSVQYRFGSGPNDREKRTRIMGIVVGDVIELREAQSGIEYEPYVVLAEDFSWAGGEFVLNHVLLPIEIVGD